MNRAIDQNPKPLLLVSVRNAAEAAAALSLGVDWIDVKDPDVGPLGLPNLQLAKQVAAVLEQFPRRSVALGELNDLDLELGRQYATNFPVVKVGLAGCHDNSSNWQDRLRRLEQSVSDLAQVVPVLYADYETCAAPDPAQVLDCLHNMRTKWLLIDTHSKRGGSLLDYLDVSELAGIQLQAAAAGATTVFAGSLKLENVKELKPLHPQVIAVRGAVCDGDRHGSLAVEKVRHWQQMLAQFSLNLAQPNFALGNQQGAR